MKAAFILSLVVAAAIAGLWHSAASAAVGGQDSSHNMTELPGYAFGTGVCGACHVPHFSSGDRIWASGKELAGDGLRDLAAAKAASEDQSAGGEYPGIYLCLDCHGGASAPSWASGAAAVKTHSTREMQAAGYTTKYPTFVAQCTDCHDPHIYWDGSFAGGTNGFMVLSQITPPSGGPRTVVFTGMTGAGSMGTNTSPYDSVCEVCHTATTFHKQDGAPAHNDGKDCTGCHLHSGGFSALACDSCHGDPPASYATLVGRPGNPGPPPTGASTPGEHLFHVLSTSGGTGYGCAVCHRAGMGDGESEDAEIDVRFGFAGFTSGSFDGFAPISGYTFSAGNTTGGSLGCAATYCHGNFEGGNQSNVPVWDDESTGDCGTCHGTAPPALEDHSVHLSASWGPMADCEDCHPAGSNIGRHSGHVDGLVRFSDGQDLAGTTVCDGCHGTTPATKPTWGDTGVRGQTNWCESCHDGSSTVNTAAGTSGLSVTAPNVLGDGATYGFDITGHGKVGGNGLPLSCTDCHPAGSPHIDGVSPSYSAAADNFGEGYRLSSYNVTPNTGDYSSAKIGLCYLCHTESRIVGMPSDGKPSAMHVHSVVPSAVWYTNFRNMSTAAGLFAGNWDIATYGSYVYDVPTNIHWNHMDDYGSSIRESEWFGHKIYDSDGDGTGDSNITCEACHNPHGTNSPAMVLDAFSLSTFSALVNQSLNPSYRWLGSSAYITNRCTEQCHLSGDADGTSGTKYYREPGGPFAGGMGIPMGLKAAPLP